MLRERTHSLSSLVLITFIVLQTILLGTTTTQTVYADSIPSLTIEQILKQYYNFSSSQMRWWIPLPDGSIVHRFFIYRYNPEDQDGDYVHAEYGVTGTGPNGTVTIINITVDTPEFGPFDRGTIDDMNGGDARCTQYGCAVTYTLIDNYLLDDGTGHSDYYYAVYVSWFDGRTLNKTIGPFVDNDVYGGAWDVVAVGKDYVVVQGRYTAVSQPILYVFNSAGSYYSVNLSELLGVDVYSYRIEGAIYGDTLVMPLLTNETPSGYITLYAINLTDGSVEWEKNLKVIETLVNVE